VAETESSHGHSPLNNAAWSGDAALVDLLISRGHPIDLVAPRFNATQSRWSMGPVHISNRRRATRQSPQSIPVEPLD
jgi:hypothetical protein